MNETTKSFSELRRLVGHFEARKERAKERLSGVVGSSWYFAIVGLDLSEDGFARLAPLAKLQRVIEPPGEVELAAACEDPDKFGSVGRYSQGIQLELAVSRDGMQDQACFNLAWWIVSALRVRTCLDFLMVAVSDRSWSTIAAVDDQSCHIQLLEDYPLAHRFEAARPVSVADLVWVCEHLTLFGDLLEKPAFRLAVDAICTHHHIASKRMSAAMLWSGIEALFSISAELRFRLAASIAAALEGRGQPRIECYRRVKRLYDFRSRLVHGASAPEDSISEHIVEVRNLLARLICRWVDSGLAYDDPRVEELLFG